MNNTTIIFDKAQEFAQQHYVQAAVELLEMKRTSILPDGKIRELVMQLESLVGSTQALRIAETLVVNACLEAVARTQTHESS